MNLSEVKIVSPNRFARRFIDPPVFEVLPRPGAAKYVAVIEQDSSTGVLVEPSRSSLDLASIWQALKPGSFAVTLEIHDQNGPVARSRRQLIKAADWQGLQGTRQDWATAADRNIAFLIDAAEAARAPFREPGVPAWVWSSAGPEPHNPNGRSDAYPALHMGLFIRAFLAHARLNRPQREQALGIANFCGDWLLKNRHANHGRCPLFPFSTIGRGKFEGGNEGTAINLLRASFLATGLFHLYRTTQRRELLDYALHIADVTATFQRHDGSFPHRVDPATGRTIEYYSAHGVVFAKLVDELQTLVPDVRRAVTARRAIDWMLAYPLTTNHWQGAYEDVTEKLPFENLENAAAIAMVRYLCRHAREDPAYLPAARRLNRWIEDQFVLFAPDATVAVRCPTPLVFEQYGCYYPMEVHTAHWMSSLVDLHRATGEKVYLDKAQAAANAICASQFPNGEFSTWGHDPTTGKRCNPHSNWYGCNAWATAVLYDLHEYVRSVG